MTYGYGQQMSALEAVLTQLIEPAGHPVTAANGGISKGDPSAGTQGDGGTTITEKVWGPVTTGDRAGAWVLTVVVLVGWLGGVWWMVKPDGVRAWPVRRLGATEDVK